MAEIKISDLTPKGVNLAVTDLLVISEDIGGGLYETKSITGDEVLNAVAKTAVAVRNQSGATIYKGTIVYISGASGGKALISKAQANSEATSSKTLGVVTADIANNANGNVLTNGLLTDLDTRTTATNPFTADTLTIGDDLYLSPTNAGYVTNVKPIAPNNLVNIGKVLETSGTTGQILYAIVNGYELGELHDVDTTGAVSGNVLALNGGIWKPTTISTGLTIGTTPITSGTVGRVLFEGAGNVVQENTDFSYADNCLNLSQYLGGTTRQLYLSGGRSFGMDVAWSGANTTAIRVVNSGSGTNVGISSNVYNGTNNYAFYSANGDIVAATGKLGVGITSPAARLDVRAQGALSTDVAFRVRNSADTDNLFEIKGNSNYRFLVNGESNVCEFASSVYASLYNNLIIGATNNATVSPFIQGGRNSFILASGTDAASSLILGTKNNTAVIIGVGATNTTNSMIANFSERGLLIGGKQTSVKKNTSGTNLMLIEAGTIPTTMATDCFGLYSADIVAGNAAPHFRTENGSVIKLYKQDLPTNPTNAELATFLSNLGLANLI